MMRRLDGESGGTALSTWARIRLFLLYAIIGPFVGGLVACPITACLTGSCIIAPDDPSSGFLNMLGFCGIIGPFAGYVLGIIPAAVTGGILAWLAPPPGRAGLWRALAVSAAVTVVYAIAYFAQSGQGESDRWGTLAFGFAMLAAGLFSGFACWWLARLLERGLDRGSRASPGR